MAWSWYYVDSEGARLKGSSRLCSSLYAYGILDEGYKFNMLVEEAAELAWRAFTTQYSLTELVVAVFLVGLTDQFLSGRKAFSVRLDLKKQSKIWLSFLLT
ncbi:proteasome subunit beta type-5-like [Triticum dicoccoides]|uniref:proteasome subunit beta type-5-like n=1 Tax=Triticum dicoccoides TaxID=85692 RepID=UPI001890099B|nr:proteasome subunit beta type-5-like [Triticum dicoccoides]